jgi:dihydrofolate reductase
MSSWLRPGLPAVRAASRRSLVDTNSSCGDLAEVIKRLKQERSEGYLLTRVARGSAARGLIDEYRLVVHPVVLSADERLFPAPLALAPTSTTVFSAGAAAHVFAAHP